MKKAIESSQLHKFRSLSIIFITSISAVTIYTLFNFKKIFYNQFLTGLDITNTELGILFALYGIACTLSYLPGGIIGDRIAMKILASSSLALTALLMFLVAMTPSFWLLCIIFFFYGICAGLLFWSCRYKLIRLVTVRERDYGRNISWSYFIGALTGIAINWLLTLVYIKLSESCDTAIFPKLMIICGVINLFIALICFLVIPYFKHELSEGSGRGDNIKKSLALLKHSDVILCSLIMFLVYSLYSLTYVTTAYLQNIYFAAASFVALISTIRSYGVNLIANPFMGYLSKIFLPSRIIEISALLLAGIFFIFLIMPQSGNLLIVASVGVIIFGFLINGIYGITSALLVEIKTPTEQFASTVGIFSLIGFLPDAILPPIVGLILDNFGTLAYKYLNIMFFIIAILIWLSTNLLFRCTHLKGKK